MRQQALQIDFSFLLQPLGWQWLTVMGGACALHGRLDTTSRVNSIGAECDELLFLRQDETRCLMHAPQAKSAW